MARLIGKDLQQLSDVLVRLYALRDDVMFSAETLSIMPSVVRCDIASFFAVDPQNPEAGSSMRNPPDAFTDEDYATTARLLSHEPLVRNFETTGDGTAHMVSDYLTTHEWNNNAIYNELYRKLGMDRELGFVVLPSKRVVFGMGMFRNHKRKDFSERDRLLVNLLRPHLGQAFQNAVAVSGLRRQVRATNCALQTVNRGVLSVTPQGKLLWASEKGRHLLESYFGRCDQYSGQLPQTLLEWVLAQQGSFSSATQLEDGYAPLHIAHSDRCLCIRIIFEENEVLLLLHEESMDLPRKMLRTYMLTQREMEVLRWLIEGKTNVEIGMILGAKSRTIHKHLTRIYHKLGVENRMAAAALVTQLKKDGPES